MLRLPMVLSVSVFVAAAGGLLAVQPPKEAPKEPTHDGKTLSEWITQLTGVKDAEQQKARESLCELGRRSDAIVEKLIEAGCDAAQKNQGRRVGWITIVLSEIGPSALPTLTQGLWSDDKVIRSVCLKALGNMRADAHAAGPSVGRYLTEVNSQDDGAIDALRKIGGPSAIRAFTKLVDDRDEHVRLEAAEHLIDHGEDASKLVPLVTVGLANRESRRKATRLLGDLGREATPALPALTALLPEADEALFASLAKTLGQIGPGAKETVPALKKAWADLKKKTPEIQGDVALALWKINRDPDAGKLLRENLGKESESFSWEPALWRIDPGMDTIAALEKQLKSEKPEEVIAAAGILGLKSKEAVPRLGKLLAQKGAVRSQAVVALAQLGPQAKEAIDALRATIKDNDSDDFTALWAAITVCRLDPKADAVATVASYLDNRHPDIRRDAVEALGLLGPAAKPAVPKLTLALSDADPRGRLAVAVAFWKIDQNPIALPSVVELLRSNDPQIREDAVVELGGTFGPEAKSAVSALAKRLFDPFSAVRSAAAEAIGRVGTGASTAAPILLALLEGDEPAFVQSAACEAIGLIDPIDKETAASVLKKKLDSYDGLVRVHAALALHRLTADKAGEKIADLGLGSRQYQVRITAAEALWRMNKDERVVPVLVRSLEESNLDGGDGENERYMAVRALGRIGAPAKPAVPELLKLISHHDLALAATASAALKAIDPDATKKPGVK